MASAQVEIFATHESDAEFQHEGIFAEPGHMQFKKKKTTTNLRYDRKYCPFSDHTNVIRDLQLFKPYTNRLARYVHHSQATLLATRFWQQIINPAQLHSATNHFDGTVKCTLSYWLATLQHIPSIHCSFDGNSASQNTN